MDLKFHEIIGIIGVLCIFVWMWMVTAMLNDLDAKVNKLDKTVVIHEDDPRWDCHTMGNRICGPGHDK